MMYRLINKQKIIIRNISDKMHHLRFILKWKFHSRINGNHDKLTVFEVKNNYIDSLNYKVRRDFLRLIKTYKSFGYYLDRDSIIDAFNRETNIAFNNVNGKQKIASVSILGTYLMFDIPMFNSKIVNDWCEFVRLMYGMNYSKITNYKNIKNKQKRKKR